MELRPPLQPLVEPWILLRWAATALVIAAVGLGDGYALIIVARRAGVFGVLAAAGATGLLPLVLILTIYRAEVRAAREVIDSGSYPKRCFRRMGTLLVACGLFLMPGFVSDVMGFALLIRPLGWPVGAALERSFRSRFVELYEHERAGLR